jgi:hypothetical protein
LQLAPDYNRWPAPLNPARAVCAPGVSGHDLYLQGARRGHNDASIPAAKIGGCLAGAGTVALTATCLSMEQLTAWGWRVPFVLGSAVGLVACLVRRGLTDPPEYTALICLTGRAMSPGLLVTAAAIVSGISFLLSSTSNSPVPAGASWPVVDARRALR